MRAEVDAAMVRVGDEVGRHVHVVQDGGEHAIPSVVHIFAALNGSEEVVFEVIICYGHANSLPESFFIFLQQIRHHPRSVFSKQSGAISHLI